MTDTPRWAIVFPEPHDDGDGFIHRSTGPRREPPAICYRCGSDVPDGPRFGGVTCGKPACRDAEVRR